MGLKIITLMSPSLASLPNKFHENLAISLKVIRGSTD
jgi:hypothetical protein